MQVVDSPRPVPRDDQVLIRVVVSACNPKDWKQAGFVHEPTNSGDDLAGFVEAVGPNVIDFKPGDRVAAFHEMLTPHGAFAEYAIAWAHTTFHIPPCIEFEEAATLPLAAMTAALGLFRYLQLPPPWVVGDESAEQSPILVYGAGGAVGSFAVQWAQKSRAHPIICVAGQSKSYVETLIDRSKGDTVVDYRGGDDAVVSDIKAALAGKPLLRAFDAVSEHGSDKIVGAVLSPNGRMAIVLPKAKTRSVAASLPRELIFPELEGVPPSVQVSFTGVGSVHSSDKDFGFLFFRYLSRGLQEGWFKAHPHQVIPGGLNGISTALKNLRNGEAHSVKYVIRIAETAGLEWR